MQQNVILIWDTPGYVISFERACILIYFHSSAAWKSQYFHFLDTQLCRGNAQTMLFQVFSPSLIFMNTLGREEKYLQCRIKHI